MPSRAQRNARAEALILLYLEETGRTVVSNRELREYYGDRITQEEMIWIRSLLTHSSNQKTRKRKMWHGISVRRVFPAHPLDKEARRYEVSVGGAPPCE